MSALCINNSICEDPKLISEFVSSFYEILYQSDFNYDTCKACTDNIQNVIPLINNDFKNLCDSDLKREELQLALRRMKKGKSPGPDGLSIEFYQHFWYILEEPLFLMFNDCIKKKELATTMKQGLISLIPKPDKDPLEIDNWRPITLLNTDYKLIALIYARRLKSGLDQIINESQTGFMKNRHISNNIRLIFDLLDYSDQIESGALILFLDFCKAFDTIEHGFLLHSLKVFGFGNNFIDIIEMFYNDINSSIILNMGTSKIFGIHRGVRQGCPISPFLFLLVSEILSIQILNNQSILGLKIFDREVKISQLADDTALFLKDKSQVKTALDCISKFTKASGLKLNLHKCEILFIHNSVDLSIENIPVKDSVKYLGIYISKNKITCEQFNFVSKLKKTKHILNNWLQRDLTIFGRVLLSKAEGLYRFVYPALSMYVSDEISKDINKSFLDFIWKNKPYQLKKDIISGKRVEVGLEMIDFFYINNTFKLNWLRNCLKNDNSMWFFIPQCIFQKLGGLSFLLRCNFLPGKLPIKLSKFHQQVLLAWKISFHHNFSPHKMLLWNNCLITSRNKSLYLHRWFERNILYILL